LGEADAGEELWPADLRNLAEMEAAARGADAIIHLGAVSKEADWNAIHETNIVGIYNILEAARQCNVARVVLASSNHVTGLPMHAADWSPGSDQTRQPVRCEQSLR
jgi:uronate dehydrogenase